MSPNTFADSSAVRHQKSISSTFLSSESVRDIAAAPLPCKPGSPASQARPAQGPRTRAHVPRCRGCHHPRHCPLREAPASRQARCGSHTRPWRIPAPGRWVPRALGARHNARTGAPGTMRRGSGCAPRDAGLQRLAKPPRQPREVQPAAWSPCEPSGVACGRDRGQSDQKARFGRVDSGHSSPGSTPQSQPPEHPLGPQQRSFSHLGRCRPLLTAWSQPSGKDMNATFTHKMGRLPTPPGRRPPASRRKPPTAPAAFLSGSCCGGRQRLRTP